MSDSDDYDDSASDSSSSSSSSSSDSASASSSASDDLEEDFYSVDGGDDDAESVFASELSTRRQRPVDGPSRTVYLYGEDRRTRPLVNAYERTALISQRTLAIQNGQTAFVEYNDQATPMEIAQMEFAQRRMPLLISRRVPRWPGQDAPPGSVYYEVWDPNEMVH